MVYHGTVQHGVVVFSEQSPLPEGTRVRIEAVDAPTSAHRNGRHSIWDTLDELAGTAEGLPQDSAENHDQHRRNRLGL